MYPRAFLLPILWSIFSVAIWMVKLSSHMFIEPSTKLIHLVDLAQGYFSGIVTIYVFNNTALKGFVKHRPKTFWLLSLAFWTLPRVCVLFFRNQNVYFIVSCIFPAFIILCIFAKYLPKREVKYLLLSAPYFFLILTNIFGLRGEIEYAKHILLSLIAALIFFYSSLLFKSSINTALNADLNNYRFERPTNICVFQNIDYLKRLNSISAVVIFIFSIALMSSFFNFNSKYWRLFNLIILGIAFVYRLKTVVIAIKYKIKVLILLLPVFWILIGGALININASYFLISTHIVLIGGLFSMSSIFVYRAIFKYKISSSIDPEFLVTVFIPLQISMAFRMAASFSNQYHNFMLFMAYFNFTLGLVCLSIKLLRSQ